MATRARTESIATPVDWFAFRDWFDSRWKQNEHVSILGTTQSGKTTLAGELLESRECVIVIATKPRDKVVDRFRDLYGYRVQERLNVPRVEDRAGRMVPHHAYRRIVLWPKERKTAEGRWRPMREMGEYQAGRIQEAFEYVSRAGGWTLFTDEVRYLAETCRLDPELKWLWQQSASSGISVVAATQRPSWVPRDMYSAPMHLFFFGTNDRDDLERLRDVGGRIDRKLLEQEIASLDHHEWLYLAPHEHPPRLYRSKVVLEGRQPGEGIPRGELEPGWPERPET